MIAVSKQNNHNNHNTSLPSIQELLIKLRNELNKNGYELISQLTSRRPLTLDTNNNLSYLHTVLTPYSSYN